MRIIQYIVPVLVYFVMSCATEESQVEEVLLTEVNISLDSIKFQKVYNLIDRWQHDSLVSYLKHRDPSFRVLALKGFAGMINEKYVDHIGETILDPIVEVRRMAAYVLGQSRTSKAVPYLMQVFEHQDSLGIDPLTFRFALEAVGKCADSSFLPLLAGISTYRTHDTLLLEGQCLGILELANLGYSHPLATELMIRYATNDTFPPSVQLIAANYLDRTRSVDLTSYHHELISAYENQKDPEIRMFLAKAVGKSGNLAGPWIRQVMRREEDARVQVSLLQGSTTLPLNVRHAIWASALRDPNERVATVAADLIVKFGSSEYAETYLNWAFSNFTPTVYANILAAGNKFITNARFHEMIEELVIQRIRNTNDPYIKTDFIRAASQHGSTALQLPNFDGDNEVMVVRTSILEALADYVDRTGTAPSRIRDFLIDRWESGDAAALSILSPLFARHSTLFPTIAGDPTRWTQMSESISMPQGIEAKIAVDQAREVLFDFTYDPRFYMNEMWHTHPIDWTLYNSLSAQPRAKIETTAGTLLVELFKEEAPGTVLNFIQLAESGYYENRPLHRVVPNFVIQAGCNRGDGYGSLDHTIRSEVGPRTYHQSGLLGMASAGLHTESQQWFVTLRPTLHLNGRYTIFGRMVEGAESAADIRRGDSIKSIKIVR